MKTVVEIATELICARISSAGPGDPLANEYVQRAVVISSVAMAKQIIELSKDEPATSDPDER